MKSHSFQIRGMNQGLVPHPSYPAGANYASRMRNLRPQEYAATNPEWFTCPFEFTLDWPFPMVYRGENVTLLFHRDSVSSLSADWTETPLEVKQADDPAEDATITGGGIWQVASFEDNWFATNGVDFLFKTAAHNVALKATGLTVQTLCAHNDRLIMAGIAGDWFTGSGFQELFRAWREKRPLFAHDQMEWSDRWVIWSERVGGAHDVPFWPLLALLGVFGTDMFNALKAEFLTRTERGEVGFSSVRKLGAPVACGQLERNVVLYSTEGRVMLSPSPDGSYIVVPTQNPGVANRGALCASPGRHVWITPSRELSSQRAGEGMQPMRQAHRLTGSLANLVASYDPEDREHWFSTENWSYVVNDFGVGGPMDIRPTGLMRANGALIGAGANLALETVPVECYSHVVDMGRKGSKRVRQVDVRGEGLAGLLVDVEAHEHQGTPYSTGAVQANAYWTGHPQRSGNEFLIGAKGTGNVGQQYSISQFTAWFQPEDRRFTSGTIAVAEDA